MVPAVVPAVRRLVQAQEPQTKDQTQETDPVPDTQAVVAVVERARLEATQDHRTVAVTEATALRTQLLAHLLLGQAVVAVAPTKAQVAQVEQAAAVPVAPRQWPLVAAAQSTQEVVAAVAEAQAAQSVATEDQASLSSNTLTHTQPHSPVA